MRYLASRPQRVSAMLLRTEALRTAVRAILSPQRMLLVRALLDGVSFITAGVTLSDEAGYFNLKSSVPSTQSISLPPGPSEPTWGHSSHTISDWLHPPPGMAFR